MGDIVMFWCEKTVTSQNATLEFNDYSTTERKFADGVGKSTITNHEELFIESSSGIAKEAVQHSLDDTIKLIIECTNSLGQSIRHHKNASMTTMCEKEVYAIQVIVNKLTLFKVSLKPELKWKVMEVRSSALPVTWETRFCFLEMFELMATLILGQEKQSQVHEKLLMESQCTPSSPLPLSQAPSKVKVPRLNVFLFFILHK